MHTENTYTFADFFGLVRKKKKSKKYN